MKTREEVLEIGEKYYINGCYRGYRGSDEGEFDIKEELLELFKSKNVKYSIDFKYGFDSPGYACDFLSIAWIREDGELETTNYLLETM